VILLCLLAQFVDDAAADDRLVRAGMLVDVPERAADICAHYVEMESSKGDMLVLAVLFVFTRTWNPRIPLFVCQTNAAVVNTLLIKNYFRLHGTIVGTGLDCIGRRPLLSVLLVECVGIVMYLQ